MQDERYTVDEQTGNGESVRSLAASFGVSRGAVWGVVTGEKWDLGGAKVERDG